MLYCDLASTYSSLCFLLSLEQVDEMKTFQLKNSSKCSVCANYFILVSNNFDCTICYVQKRLPRTDVAEEEDSGEDALEALFSQLEEDLDNDDQSLYDDDEDVEMKEEDLANLDRELAEALEEDEQLGSFDSHDDGVIGESEDDDDDYDDPEEELGKLKNWQLKRLAYALKNGRRKTGVSPLILLYFHLEFFFASSSIVSPTSEPIYPICMSSIFSFGHGLFQVFIVT